MFTLALLIISSVIGAGFATGAEIVAFFGRHNLPPALVGVLTFVTLFPLLTLLVYLPNRKEVLEDFDKKRKRPQTPPTKITQHLVLFLKKLPAPLFVYMIFFVGMTAGLATLLGRPITIVALAACIAITLGGFNKLLWINKYLMYLVLGVLLFTIITHMGTPTPLQGSNISGGMLSALLYAGLNVTMLPPIIRQAKKRHSRTEVLLSCLLASTVVSGLVMLIIAAIQNNHISAPIPMVALADNLFVKLAIFFSIFTSMLVALYNIHTTLRHKRKDVRESNAVPYIFSLLIVCTIAFFATYIGFTQIVGFFYPLIGTGTLVFTLSYGVYCLYRHIRALRGRSCAGRHPTSAPQQPVQQPPQL